MRIFISLEKCVFNHPGHLNGGDPCFFIDDDGLISYHCFHPDCSCKSIKDVEEKLGTIKPTIKLGTDLDRVLAETKKVLPDDDSLYQRDALLVQFKSRSPVPPQVKDTNGAACCEAIPREILLPKLTGLARFEKLHEKKGWIGTIPNNDLVRAVLASGPFEGVRPLMNVVSGPIILPSGDIVATPGYDDQSGCFLDVENGYPEIMPLVIALKKIRYVFQDFPHAKPAHESAAIACLLSLSGRQAFDGPAPMFPNVGNQPGLGKGLEGDVTTMIYEGRVACRQPYPYTDEELVKIITATAINGKPYILLDNCEDELGGGVLESAVTSTRYTGRILGLSKSVDLPLRIIWMASLNGANYSHDMQIRRVCPVELSTNLEFPDKRDDFAEPNLLQYCRDNRKDLAIAALSILHHFIKAGKPDQHLSTWGSFQEWSDLIRSAIVWANLADPDSREDLIKTSNSDAYSLLRQLVASFSELGATSYNTAVTVSNAVGRGGSNDEAVLDSVPTLRDLLSMIPHRDKNHALGQLLSKYRGRICENKKLERTDHAHPRWFISDVEQYDPQLTLF
ncbi:MAG: hypothetical protein ABSE63_00930 [Thermoguttaceae bacterium]|jgi:hypothetical protein